MIIETFSASKYFIISPEIMFIFVSLYISFTFFIKSILYICVLYMQEKSSFRVQNENTSAYFINPLFHDNLIIVCLLYQNANICLILVSECASILSSTLSLSQPLMLTKVSIYSFNINSEDFSYMNLFCS